jgi:hypothetical protein
VGVGAGGGAEATPALSLDCPQIAVLETNNTSMNANLLYPIQLIPWLERSDHTDGHGRTGKQRDRLRQVLEESRASTLFRNEDGVSGLQGSSQDIA